MSEPIKLFDRDGNPVTRYSPNMAQMEVAAGLLFHTPPADVDDMPALDGMPGDDEPTPEYNAKRMREYVERVERKVGRPRKGKGAL
jgi:hypothetical protein